MTNGLISTFEGRLILIAIWGALAPLAALACTTAVMLRKAPPLTTQTDQRTGVKEHGIGRWLLTFLAIFVGPVVLVTLIVTGFEIIAVMPVWVWPVAAAVAVGVVVVAMFIRAQRRAADEGWEPPQPELAAYVPKPPQTVGWSLPDGIEHWESRS